MATRALRHLRADMQMPPSALKEAPLPRLLDMEPEQVLHNASLFKEVLESQEFRDGATHLQSIVSLLAAKACNGQLRAAQHQLELLKLSQALLVGRVAESARKYSKMAPRCRP